MPERSFGRIVRYRRTKLGLSQARLGDLVGRSPSTIRSWERDQALPKDPETVSALAAVIGANERALLEKAGFDLPNLEERPTMEQALASLAPSTPTDERSRPAAGEPGPSWVEKLEALGTSRPAAAEAPALLTAPPEPVISPAPPLPVEPSYIDDPNQQQVYRFRTIATTILLIALVVVLAWALNNGIDAAGDLWEWFLSQLRL